MAALSQARVYRAEVLATIGLPLAAAAKAYTGGMACGDTSTGTVKQGQASTTLIRLGSFEQTFDNTSGTASVTVLVRLERPVNAAWFDNATGANAVLASDLFNDVYILDDHTVTKATSGNSKAGMVWAVDSVKGVLVSAGKQY